MLVGNGGCHDVIEVVQVGREGSRCVVGGAETHGGDMGCVSGQPGHMDRAMELGAGRPYINVGCGHAAGGVRAWGKQVGSGEPSEYGGGGARARVWGVWW